MMADYHIHSRYSDDCEENMEQVVISAMEKGIDEICFTDHVDYGIKIDYDIYSEMSKKEKEKQGKALNVDYFSYFNEIAMLQEKYKGRIIIRKGLEFGIQVHTVGLFQKLYDRYDLDFVILSCHQVNDRELWTGEFQKGKVADEYNREYYEEIYNVMNVCSDYSILGHLDHIQRYNKQFNGEIHPFEKDKEMIQKILKKAIEDGKGIEVNTSSFAYGMEDLTPARKILELYYELGGEIITIGSDSHKAKDVARHIPYIMEELKRIGFKKICTFEKMRPVFHAI